MFVWYFYQWWKPHHREMLSSNFSSPPEVLTKVCRLSVLYTGSTFDFLSVALVMYKGRRGGQRGAQGEGRLKRVERKGWEGEGGEIEPSALRQCIIWRFHSLASIRGGCCAIKGVSRVCVPVCGCMWVFLHVCVLRVTRVVQCLIEQDGAPLI